MKCRFLFWGGGRERGMSEEVETLRKALPPLNDLLPRTVKSFMQFSYSVTPLPEFLDPPLLSEKPPPPGYSFVISSFWGASSKIIIT